MGLGAQHALDARPFERSPGFLLCRVGHENQRTAEGAYRFGDFDLYPSERQLHHEQKPVSLPPKVFDALLLLVRNAERLVRRLAAPVPGRAVSVPFMIIYRVAHESIVEHWMQFDGAALIAQLQETAATV